MLKKALFVGGGIVLLLGLLFGRETMSYVSTAVGWAQNRVKQSVPLSFELDRARKMVVALDKDIQRHKRQIIAQEVRLRRQSEQVEEHKKALAKARREMLILAEDLKSDRTEFVYSGERFSPAQVRKNLKKRLEDFKVREATTDHKVKVLDALQSGLQASRDRLLSMENAKQKLQLEIEHLDARMERLEVEKANSEVKIDDSRLARTRDLLNAIKDRLEVDERMLNSSGAVPGEIRLGEEKKEEADIAEQVTDYFGQGRKLVESLVETE